MRMVAGHGSKAASAKALLNPLELRIDRHRHRCIRLPMPNPWAVAMHGPSSLQRKPALAPQKRNSASARLTLFKAIQSSASRGSLLVFGQAAPRSCCSVLQPLSPRCSIRCRPYSPEPSSCASCQSMILQNAIQCKPGDTKCHCALNAVYTTWSVEFVVCTLSYFPFLVDMPRSNR